MGNKIISGFSELTKRDKIDWIVENFFSDPETVKQELISYWHRDKKQQEILDGFSENTLSNFPLPYSVAPNFLINEKLYAVPMVIEESSVVAAASSAAKYWLNKGGFKAEVLNMKKIGQLYFKSTLPFQQFADKKEEVTHLLLKKSQEYTQNMETRGGGILGMEFGDLSHELEDIYRLNVHFDTCDSMGANFINTIMEIYRDELPRIFIQLFAQDDSVSKTETLMAILSNYTPECLVRVEVSCPVEELACFSDRNDGARFARRFYDAVKIAKIDPYRATTHNKGIFNGVDAVIIATGNDFRAIEAGGHAYASRSGRYSSLSDCAIKNGIFRFWLEMPLALGTVGGLTALHPIVKRSLELLGSPDAEELMTIVAAVGLGQNFSAIRSLVTTGIQYGHMKMHLQNILRHLNASENETNKAKNYFKDKTVSYHAVRLFLEEERLST